MYILTVAKFVRKYIDIHKVHVEYKDLIKKNNNNNNND